MWYNDLRPDSRLNNDRYSLIMLDSAENNYARLMDDEMKQRTISKLRDLHAGLRANVPGKKVDQNLLLASWNIKNFGKITQRTPESLYYMAEIINAFDIVAVQEINSDITHFKKVVKILGSHWKYVYSDVTEGTKGNDERFGYIYDSRRIQHSGLAGELVVSPEMMEEEPIIRQFKRTPAFTGFQSGWKKFTLTSVHLHPGDKTNGPDNPRDDEIRDEEVRLLLELLEKKREEGAFEDKNMIILGDTNIYQNDHHIVNRITNAGFVECDSLIGQPTNTSLNQGYDRIFLNVDDYFHLAQNSNNQQSGGVFRLFDYVYRDTTAEIEPYKDLMLSQKGDPSNLVDDDSFRDYFNSTWKRNQMSDHLPVWIEIQTDSSQNFLSNVLGRY